MKHIVYQTTNLLNGKTYIGIHKQDDPFTFDGYLGSGFYLRQAIKKHGRENFFRRTLVICPSYEYARKVESSLVTSDYVRKQDNYNAATGGFGSPPGVKRSDAFKEKLRLAMEKREYNPEWGRKSGQARKGKKHTKEHKEKIRQSTIKRYSKPEERERQRARIVKFRESPEYRSNLSKAVKSWWAKRKNQADKSNQIQQPNLPI